MSMKYIYVKVYIKYIKIGGGGGVNVFWKVLFFLELIYFMKGRRREINLIRDVFFFLWVFVFCFLFSFTGMVLLLLGVFVAFFVVFFFFIDLFWFFLWSSFVKVGVVGIEDLIGFYIYEIYLVYIWLRF